MSGSSSGNTPTTVGWIAAFLVGAAVFAVLHYPVGFQMVSSMAIGIAATLLVILLLSSPGAVEDVADSRVRKIVPQPEPAPKPVLAEPVRPAVMPTRVTATTKADMQPEAPVPAAAVSAPSPVSAQVAPEPVGFVEAPPAAAELVSRRKPAAPVSAEAPEAMPLEKPAAKPKAASKPKVEKSAAEQAKAEKPKAKKPAAKAKPAKSDGPARLSAPRGGKADDLKQIEGIGPALEKLVNSLGFHHFDQIAAWSEADVALVDAEMKNFKGRIARDRWVAQAKIIVTEGLEAFRERAKTNNY